MLKVAVVLMTSWVLMFGAEYKLDETSSNVYYEAKKDQFFSTYTMLGINKLLSGVLVKEGESISGELSIKANGFVTDSTTRDENVAEHLNSETKPLITFVYTIENMVANGEMSINGVSKELSFPVVMSEDETQIFIDGNITVKYTDFGMEAPSNFILSSHEDLVIGANLHFTK